jgi:DNA-binding LacI/PurR family transcriptional regulator
MLWLNLVGTFVFGLSGGLAAVRARLDVFGVVVVAAVVGLTSVRQPLFECGRRGAELLLQLVAGGADQVVEPVVEQLPVEVVIRSTTAAPG